MSGATSSTYNGVGAFAGQSTTGNTAQWVAFAATLSGGLFFFFLSYIRNVRPEARLTYYLVTAICLITALAYLIMALGNPFVRTAAQATLSYPAMSLTQQVDANGNVFTATTVMYTGNLIRTFSVWRIASYAIVAPITMVLLAILAGAHWTEFIWTSLSAVLSISGLFAAIITTGPNAKWPLYAFALVFGLPVAIALVYTFRIAAHKVHPEIGRLYDVVGFGSLFLYFGYAINAGVSELGYVTSVDQEVIIYAALDILSKVVFGFVLIWSRESIARYGTFLGTINTGVDFDFPIQRSTYTGSGSNYATEPTQSVAYGEHRDLAFAQLHAATNTQKTQGKELAYNPWP